MNLIERHFNILFASFLFAVIMMFAIISLDSGVFVMNFGFEYANIAQSIVEGDGFSNPFSNCETGKTAWMPPLLVYLNAMVFYLVGKTTTAFILLQFFRIALLASGVYFIFKALDMVYPQRASITKLVFMFVFWGFLFYHRNDIAFVNDDLGIHTFNIGLGVYLLYKLFRFNYRGIFLKFFLFLLPLSTPALLLPVVFIIVLHFFLLLIKKLKEDGYDKLFYLSFKILPSYLLLALFVILSVSIWTLRNYYSLGSWVLLKSNARFEFYLANIASPNGINSRSVTLLYHPNDNPRICSEIRDRGGEVEWMEEVGISPLEYIRENKKNYLFKFKNRLVNAFLLTSSTYDNKESSLLSQKNITKLDLLEKFKVARGNQWLFLLDKSIELGDDIESYFTPAEIEALRKDREIAKAFILENERGMKKIFFGFLHSGLPTLSLLLLLFIGKDRWFVLIISLFFALYLMPYVLISHVMRYQYMMIILISLILSVMLVSIISKYSGDAASPFRSY